MPCWVYSQDLHRVGLHVEEGGAGDDYEGPGEKGIVIVSDENRNGKSWV